MDVNYGEEVEREEERGREKTDLVGVDGPIGDELRKHGTEQAEESARCADRDVGLNEEGREKAAAEAGEDVEEGDLDCRKEQHKMLNLNREERRREEKRIIN